LTAKIPVKFPVRGESQPETGAIGTASPANDQDIDIVLLFSIFSVRILPSFARLS
jgi:hypothetical protein